MFVNEPNTQTGRMKLRVEAIYPKSQGTHAPWIFMASSQLGAAVYLVCLDVLSKHIKLYPFQAATTKACLN